MQEAALPISSVEPDNCEYYLMDGELITDEGFIVGDWLSPSIVYLNYSGASSVEAAHAVTSLIMDFIAWCKSPGMRGYNAVGVCHISTTKCLIAPCYWCKHDERLAKYLAMETEEGEYERIN
jgi:hypothetical protein